jgi:CheY-like chemotaxis protein
MPHVSGTEVIRQARGVRKGLPAIIITGYAEASSIARRPEDVLVLSKPFTPAQLSEAIATAVAEGSGAAALRPRRTDAPPTVPEAAE